jgi:cell division protein FtsA
MGQRADELITVIDVGSAKTRVLAAELHEGALRYRAHAIVDSKGIRKGLIADLAPATEAINKAAMIAEKLSGGGIEKCVVGVGGQHVRGVNSRGGISLGTRLREITRDDVRAAVDRARSVSLPADREVIHLLPQQYLLDDQPGIFDPVGMVGTRLEVNLHLSTCSGGVLQSIVTCANRAGLEVTETVFEAIAAAEAIVSADERELGVCLIDIGAGSTELVVFFEGSVAHTAVIPIGGDHFTNDLALGLHIPVPEAEWLKCEYGHAVVTAVPNASELTLRDGRPLRQRLIAEMLEPRAREMFYLLRDNLRQGGVLEALGAGCILTGGGAKMPGLLEVVESLIRVPARIGTPVQISRMPEELAEPECSALVGMLLYSHRTGVLRAAEDGGLRAKLKAMFAGTV